MRKEGKSNKIVTSFFKKQELQELFHQNKTNGGTPKIQGFFYISI